MTNRRALKVVLKWGLGNRVNGLINALILAQLHDRPLQLFWQRDAHCEARFEDLFQPLEQGWMDSLGVERIELSEGHHAQAVCLPRTLFCPPLNKYTAAIQRLTQGIAIEAYARNYARFWQALKWSSEVTARSAVPWPGVALNIRANRLLDYRPPLTEELAVVGAGVYIACDSDAWKKYFLELIPQSIALPTLNGNADLDGRATDSIINAAADLLVLASASRLFVHAPIKSTFSLPATHGAGVPTLRIAWRSHE